MATPKMAQFMFGDQPGGIVDARVIGRVAVLVEDPGQLGHPLGEAPTLEPSPRPLDSALSSLRKHRVELSRVGVLDVFEQLVGDLGVGADRERRRPASVSRRSAGARGLSGSRRRSRVRLAAVRRAVAAPRDRDPAPCIRARAGHGSWLHLGVACVRLTDC